jgi:hypothetical protein
MSQLNSYIESIERSSKDSEDFIVAVADIKSSEPDVFIQMVDERIKKEYIFKKLCLMNIGYIHKLTEVPCKFQQGFKRIFIRIRWNDLPQTNELRKQLMLGETIKIVYDMPWFWCLCVVNTSRNRIQLLK